MERVPSTNQLGIGTYLQSQICIGYAPPFDQDISDWNVSGATIMAEMFVNKLISAINKGLIHRLFPPIQIGRTIGRLMFKFPSTHRIEFNRLLYIGRLRIIMWVHLLPIMRMQMPHYPIGCFLQWVGSIF